MPDTPSLLERESVLVLLRQVCSLVWFISECNKELLRDIVDGAAALLCGIRDTCYNIEVSILHLVVSLGC
jgi:hypothetical protein